MRNGQPYPPHSRDGTAEKDGRQKRRRGHPNDDTQGIKTYHRVVRLFSKVDERERSWRQSAVGWLPVIS
jgi:hypothetical protein